MPSACVCCAGVGGDGIAELHRATPPPRRRAGLARPHVHQDRGMSMEEMPRVLRCMLKLGDGAAGGAYRVGLEGRRWSPVRRCDGSRDPCPHMAPEEAEGSNAYPRLARARLAPDISTRARPAHFPLSSSGWPRLSSVRPKRSKVAPKRPIMPRLMPTTKTNLLPAKSAPRITLTSTKPRKGLLCEVR